MRRRPSAPGASTPAVTPAVRYHDRARFWVVVPLVVATLLLVPSLLAGVWWEAGLEAVSPIDGVVHQSVTITFHIGGGFTCSEVNWSYAPTPCTNLTYGSIGGARGAVYAGLGYALEALIALGAVAAALLTVGNLRIRRRRYQITLEIALVATLAVATLALPLATALAGPGPQAMSDCSYLSGGTSSCAAFLGSTGTNLIPGECNVCQNTIAWGGTDSFYACLISGILFAACAAVLVSRRRSPFTLEEEVRWASRFQPPLTAPRVGAAAAAPSAAAGAPTPSPPPPPPSARPASGLGPEDTRRAFGRYEAPKGPWACPRCGAENLQWANLCRGCGAERPTDTVASDSDELWRPDRRAP
jgi:hypothetical protein